jgi:hypothetical protein
MITYARSVPRWQDRPRLESIDARQRYKLLRSWVGWGSPAWNEGTGVCMTPHTKWAIAGVVLGLILFIISPWLAIGVIVLALAVPAGAWLMLDESQRRRYRELRRRREIR